jgi:hypothetical protein
MWRKRWRAQKQALLFFACLADEDSTNRENVKLLSRINTVFYIKFFFWLEGEHVCGSDEFLLGFISGKSDDYPEVVEIFFFFGFHPSPIIKAAQNDKISR